MKTYNTPIMKVIILQTTDIVRTSTLLEDVDGTKDTIGFIPEVWND